MAKGRIFSLGVIFAIVAALAIQFGLYKLGLYQVSADESARALMAQSLSWTNVLQPWIWPPFYKVFVGLGLHVYDDMFVVPRLLVSVAGVITLLAIVFLTDRLFGDRRLNIGAAVLAIFVPQRLVLSVAPMSDIFYFTFVIIAAVFVLMWLKEARRSYLLCASLALLFASTDRYEACVFSGCLMLFLAYRLFIIRDLDFTTAFLASVILTLFPVFWALDSFVWYGSLKNLSDNREQVIAILGASHLGELSRPALVHFLRDIALGRFLLDLAINPALLLGLVALFWLCGRDSVIRNWTLIFFVPLILSSIVMVITMSIPLAAPWRVSGVWTLLLVPFTSFALMRISARLQGRTRWGHMFATALVIASVPFALRCAQLIRPQLSSNIAARQAGLYVDRLLAGRSRHGKVLLDSVDNYDFLNVIVDSNIPDRFVLNAGTDPLVVANYVPMADMFRREGNRIMIERYQTDRFALDRGSSAQSLARADILYVLVHNARFVNGLDASPTVERMRPFGAWMLYQVKHAPS